MQSSCKICKIHLTDIFNTIPKNNAINKRASNRTRFN
ncbi:hypothetical protein BAZSYMB_SCAFFOLD00064_8 [Bathymodiolus azoricus thioautotrophic gill symbiont]|uniref:Uncharacterized protein n=1 Tax=Bathymodiolus azoricus thioautotrophic gill symbiont TaxID=235205 RepID=A0A1H6L750_9GAMM|nr:hypothetical protein BAZSYMB_SCAFFOLD00064_8 [Bathymodiolus azoricus thioautotrophic gill symbiont]